MSLLIQGRAKLIMMDGGDLGSVEMKWKHDLMDNRERQSRSKAHRYWFEKWVRFFIFSDFW